MKHTQRKSHCLFSGFKGLQISLVIHPISYPMQSKNQNPIDSTPKHRDQPEKDSIRKKITNYSPPFARQVESGSLGSMGIFARNSENITTLIGGLKNLNPNANS